MLRAVIGARPHRPKEAGPEPGPIQAMYPHQGG
jgi:hypothetical protein